VKRNEACAALMTIHPRVGALRMQSRGGVIERRLSS
jgi:hypothetical protein